MTSDDATHWLCIFNRYEFAKKYVKGKIVVDAACGSGYGSVILAQNHPQKIYAFDLSEEAISNNQHKFSNYKKNLEADTM